MLLFECIEEKILSEMIKDGIDFVISIGETVFHYGDKYPGIDFSTPQEVPPKPAILKANDMTHVICGNDPSLAGKYIRFMVLVYALGGKIYYRSIGSDRYHAEVKWQR